MSGKSSPEFQWTDDDPVIELNNYADSLLEIIALTTSPTFLSRLIFYPRPTLIYVQLFLPSAVLFYQKTFISLSNITKPYLRNISSIIVDLLFSVKLKIIPNYRSRCVSIRFLERIDSYPIRLVSLSESERSNPSLLRKSCRKKSVPMETETER